MAEVFDVLEFTSPYGAPWCQARIKVKPRGFMYVAFTLPQFGLSEAEMRQRVLREAEDIEMTYANRETRSEQTSRRNADTELFE